MACRTQCGGVTRRKQKRLGIAKSDNKAKNTYIQLKPIWGEEALTGNRHNSQTKHGAPSESSPRANLHDTNLHSSPRPAPHTPGRVVMIIARVFAGNAARCASQTGRAALLHRHHWT